MLEEEYREGYRAGINGESEFSCPYDFYEAELWHDGYEDALEDLEQGTR